MILSSGQIEQLLHGNKEWQEWVNPLQTMLATYQINTPERISMFFAQCGHESLNFTVLEENLNYSEKGLNAVFPKYFQKQDVTQSCITAILLLSLLWSMLIVWAMATSLQETDGCGEAVELFNLQDVIITPALLNMLENP